MTEQSDSSKCCGDSHVGPIYEHLVTETRIEIDPDTLRIKDDAEAEIVEQYRDHWECQGCGLVTGNPFHVASA